MAATVAVTSLFYVLGFHMYTSCTSTCTLRLAEPILVGILTKVHITVLYTLDSKRTVEWSIWKAYTSAQHSLTLRKCDSVSGLTRHISVTKDTPHTKTPDKEVKNRIVSTKYTCSKAFSPTVSQRCQGKNIHVQVSPKVMFIKL